MSWAAVIAGGASLLGGYMSSRGAKDAAGASAAGSDAAIAEQRRQFDLTRQDTAPGRVIGEQALNALGSIYGYSPAAKPLTFSEWSAQNPPAATSSSGGKKGDGSAAGGALAGMAVGLDPVTGALLGESAGVSVREALDPLGLFGGSKKPKKPAVDPQREAYQRYLDEFDYMSSPKSPPGARGSGGGIDPSSGYRIGSGGSISQAIPGVTIDNETGQPVTDTAIGAAMPAGPNYSNFFASPDYTFRRDEGMRGIERTAAARGLTGSGNVLAALADYNSNLAAGEFGNYFNRQAALAGIGQTAVNTATTAGMNSANNVSGFLQNAANARASGIGDAADAWGNAFGTIAGMAYDRWGRPKKGA
jgi:hypothetical protein